jgi:hypothetical protein
MITGNKGEWSEIYALFKILGDKKLVAGNADLEKIEELFYPIIKIIRNESSGKYEYVINGDLVIVSGGHEQLRIPIKSFTEQAAKLISKIKESSGSFSMPETEEFMNSVNCWALKANSTTKSDITIVIHDQQIHQSIELGFSIKSKLGGESSLLNAGKTTNFIYQITNTTISGNDIKKINSIETKNKIKDRLSSIKLHGGEIQFSSLEQDIFKNNLILIDSFLPNILGEVIKEFFSSKLSSVYELSKVISDKNPLNYDTTYSHSFYEYKIKRFLTDCALGMMPSKVWTGTYDATGGYLIVKEDGDVLCYHIYNRNQFEDYLFYNTKLETASSKRHDFGTIYIADKKQYFKLNLQIRFC